MAKRLIKAIFAKDNSENSQLLDRKDIKTSNGLNMTGWTPLHVAAVVPTFLWDKTFCKQRLETITKLLENPEINVNAKSASGETPLHVACRTNYSEAVTKLLNVPGIEVNASDNSGKTPVMVAAEHGRVEALRLMLLDPRVKLDCRSNEGKGLEELLADFSGDYGEWLECFEMVLKVRKQRRRKNYKQCRSVEDSQLLEKQFAIFRPKNYCWQA